MKKIKVNIKGIAPYLMNKFIEEKTGSRKKKEYIPKEEAEKKANRTEKRELYIPSQQIKASIVKASTDFKMTGKKSYKEYILSGIFISPDKIVLKPQEYTIFAHPVVIVRSRVMSWRPEFKEWEAEFIIEIVDDMINETTLKEILETAGKYKGIGDWRPEHGRFEVLSFKTLE